MRKKAGGLNRRTAVASMALLARMNHFEITLAQIHQYLTDDEKITPMSLASVLTNIGMQCEYERSSWRRLLKSRKPLIVILKDGRSGIVSEIKKNKVALSIPGEDRTPPIQKSEFLSKWTKDVVLSAGAPTDQNDFENFGVKWFFRSVFKYVPVLRETILASVVIQIFALLSPLTFMIIIDKVLTHNSLATLDVLILALAVVSLFEVVLSGLRTYLLSHTTNKVDLELGVRLFRHLIALPLSYFESRRVGDTIAKIRELETVRQFLTGTGITLMIDLFFVVIFLAIMYLFSPFLTGIVIACLPLFLLISLVLTPLLRGKLEDKYTLGAENQSFLVETISSMETLKVMAAEKSTQRAWEKRMSRYVRSSFDSGEVANLTNQTITFISKALTVALLWLGAKEVLAGSLTVGQLIAFNMLATRVNQPVLRIAQIWQEFQQARVSIKRIADIFSVKPEPIFQLNRTKLPDIEGKIEFRDVEFRYRADAPYVLHGITFTVEPGQVLAVVGSSGSGKTTIVKLLQRLYVAERGQILIDGINLSMVDAHWLRRQIGVVPQDMVLYNCSIRDNIAYGNQQLDSKHVMEVSRLVGAHEFILRLPEGYDTVVGERGSILSAGQRQRIALARALAINPKLLILDEATSALDSESEQIIQQNMKTICEGRTVIIVAHRLSTVRSADRFIIVEKGSIVEQGSHRELLGAKGRYAQLHAIQSGNARARVK